MPDLGFSGYQPGQSPSDRRAAFDLRRRLAAIDDALGGTGGGSLTASRGIMAKGTMAGGTVDVAASSTASLASGLVFTPLVGRQYRLIYQNRAAGLLSAGRGTGFLEILDAGVLTAFGDVWWETTGDFCEVRGEWMFDGDGDPKDLSCRVTTAAAVPTVRFFVETTANNRFYLEDVGPA